MTQIHPSAIVDSQAELAEDVVVGPFCLVGPKVCIGAGTVLRSHVVVEGSTTIGARNVIYAGASIGCHPQDKKYRGEDTRLVVGDDNVIRENCTMSIGTIQDQGLTTVGSRNLFMANAHVAHDCQVGSDVILANNVALGGHVIVGDHAILGGQSAAHQFVRIGAYGYFPFYPSAVCAPGCAALCDGSSQPGQGRGTQSGGTAPRGIYR